MHPTYGPDTGLPSTPDRPADLADVRLGRFDGALALPAARDLPKARAQVLALYRRFAEVQGAAANVENWHADTGPFGGAYRESSRRSPRPAMSLRSTMSAVEGLLVRLLGDRSVAPDAPSGVDDRFRGELAAILSHREPDHRPEFDASSRWLAAYARGTASAFDGTPLPHTYGWTTAVQCGLPGDPERRVLHRK